jgi:hypothetical protein
LTLGGVWLFIILMGGGILAKDITVWLCVGEERGAVG